MRHTFRNTARRSTARRSTAAFAALGLAALAPAARAQTQDLFAASYDPNANAFSIERFAGTGPGTFSTTATALTAPTLDTPAGLAFDARGDLFVANASDVGTGSNSITEFPVGTAPGTFGPATTFAGGLSNPNPLVIDSRGNLFAGNGGNGTITEFAYNSVTGTLGAGTTFASGVSQPSGLTVDGRGNLFAVSATGGINGGGSVTEFAFNAATGTYGAGTIIISSLFDYPEGLAFDPRGNLFLTDQGHRYNDGVIMEYAFNAATNTFGAGTTFASGLNQPLDLKTDARGDLFVENYNIGTISEFAFNPVTGAFGTAQTVETNVPNSEYLAFGPSAPPAVPEASQAVSLGLLLMLGMGGVVLARKKKGAA